jgi:hypothetical protein
MKRWIRQWLGITEIQEDQGMLNKRLKHIIDNQYIALQHSDAMASGVARLIAKLDPMYAKPEIDPDRKAESDRLGEEVIKKLNAGQQARDYIEGEPGS